MALVTPTSQPGGTQATWKTAEKTITFDGNAGTGAVGAVPIWTVTGQIEIRMPSAFCTASLVGATATISLGSVTNTTGLIGNTTATSITTAAPVWAIATPGDSSTKTAFPYLVAGNIRATVGTAAITSGVLQFQIYYRPLSVGATVT